MSIDDPVYLVAQGDHELHFTLIRGRETFCDKETRLQLRWLTSEEAVDWCTKNLGVSPSDHLPEFAQEANEKYQKERMEILKQQPRLL